MYSSLLQFASTEAASEGGVWGALGIDGPTLLFQLIAFLVLVFVLAKWVYPTFIEAVDRRQARISESLKAADAAQKAAATSEKHVEALLKEARGEAQGIITTAKEEASALLQAAEDRARAKGDALVAAARQEIESDIQAAKKALRAETIELVAQATEKVVGSVVSDKVDEALIAKSLKELS